MGEVIHIGDMWGIWWGVSRRGHEVRSLHGLRSELPARALAIPWRGVSLGSFAPHIYVSHLVYLLRIISTGASGRRSGICVGYGISESFRVEVAKRLAYTVHGAKVGLALAKSPLCALRRQRSAGSVSRVVFFPPTHTFSRESLALG